MSIFKALTGVVVDIVLLPVAIVKDVITVGGMATETDKPYTVSQGADLLSSFERLEDELKKLAN